MRQLEANLQAEARKAKELIIWTDCDREGECIGAEIAEVCLSANARLVVKRARFSSIIAADIYRAMNQPQQLDMRMADAVRARMELDLRIGAAITRWQTLRWQAKYPLLAKAIVSYGSCFLLMKEGSDQKSADLHCTRLLSVSYARFCGRPLVPTTAFCGRDLLVPRSDRHVCGGADETYMATW